MMWMSLLTIPHFYNPFQLFDLLPEPTSRASREVKISCRDQKIKR